MRRRARLLAAVRNLFRQAISFAVQAAGHVRPVASRVHAAGCWLLKLFRPLVVFVARGLSVLLTPFRPILRRAWVRLSPLADRLRRSRLYPYLPRVRKVRLAIVSLFIMGTIASFVLPALQAHAASLTWTNNSDFSNNQISRCQTTTMNGVVVSGTGYGDPTCATGGQDSSMQLDSAPDYFTGVASVSTSTTGTTVALNPDPPTLIPGR